MDSTRQIIPLLILVIASTISIFSCVPEPTPVIPTTPPANLPPGATGWQQQWEQTLALAKTEGEVLVYSTMPVGVRVEVSKAMSDKYGIDLLWVGGSPTELARKVIEEKSRGINIADAIVVGGGTMVTILKPQGLMAPLRPLLILPDVKDEKVWKAGQVPYIDEDGTGVGLLTIFYRNVLVNTDMVKKDEVASYHDLLKPRYKGQIVFQDPTVTGGSLTWTSHLKRIWGLEQTKDYLRQLARQEPIITRDAYQGVEWVARGKYPVGLGQTQTQAVEFIEKAGAPLVFPLIREKGRLSTGASVFGVFTRPGHPNAVAILLNWLLSQEGQTILYKAFAMPSSRADIKEEGISPTFYRQPGEEFLLQSEEELLKLPEMIALNREIFGIK